MDHNDTPIPVNPAFIRAVLICHFPERFTKDSIVPRLKEFGVDILRTVNVERSPDFKPGDAEVIICMTDFISHTAYNAARGVARKHSRPFIAITRKAAEWDEKFAKFKQEKLAPRTKLQLVAPSPASSRAGVAVPVSAEFTIPAPPDSEPPELVAEMGVEQYKELLGMFEAENVRLEAEVRPLQQRLEETDALAGSLEKRLSEASKAKVVLQKKLDEEKTALKAQTSHVEQLIQAGLSQQTIIDRLQAALAEAGTARVEKSIDKEVLLNWSRLLYTAKAGNAASFQALLEIAGMADISPIELLALLRG